MSIELTTKEREAIIAAASQMELDFDDHYADDPALCEAFVTAMEKLRKAGGTKHERRAAK